MKKLLYILILLVSYSVSAQEITGRIFSDDNEALEGINVQLENTNFHTVTNEYGEFTFKNLPKGNYTLVASAIAYSAKKELVLLSEHHSIFLNLKLSKLTTLLQEVIIEGRRNSFKDQASVYTSKMRLKDIENPQVSSVVSSQVLTEQAVSTLNSAVRSLNGVSRGWAWTNSFYIIRGFHKPTYMRNGVASYATSDPDVTNLEQLQAIKGPSGTLYGSTLVSFGGLINRITKKPFDGFHTEIGYHGGSYGLSRFTADVNVPLDKEKNVLFRVNASYHYSGSFQDSGFMSSTFIAPSLTYRVNDRLSFNMDIEILSKESTPEFELTPAGKWLGNNTKNHSSAIPIDYKKSFSNNSQVLKNPSQSLYGQINYKISDKWNSQTNIIRTVTENSGDYPHYRLLQGDSLLQRNTIQYGKSTYAIVQIQQNFTGEFRLAKLRNRVLLGLDYYSNSSNTVSNSLGEGGRPSIDTLNILHPMPGYSNFNSVIINQKLSAYTPTSSLSDVKTYSVYGSDVINFTDRLSAMLSVRIDRYINEGTTRLATNTTTGAYNQTAVSPKFGLVYQLFKDRVSLFGNYMNGFQNVAPFTQPDGTVSVFKPQMANQWEFGIKTDLSNEKLTATISYYDISLSNIIRSSGTTQGTNYRVQDGTQNSRGFEADIYSKPVEGLLLNAGYAYNHSTATSSNAAFQGLRPEDAGPESTLTFYASYNISRGVLSGLGAGFGGNYSSKNVIINNRNQGEFYLEAYRIYNAGIFYNRSRYRFAANVDNLANSKYYTGSFWTYSPGMLRKLTISATLKF
ncbi:TonB-dependent receptor [Flavobacterium piscisymbiosum]|uniref:TonB-dependent receptor n=1 Tax=Flavobacterium piscisymbiosum TaxID=2893753 RepID=A0ABS8MDW3_9FLAO|nr:TonB-dependent receptor [Flavobacterium sp. F-30]MCC9063718.1 TonB-dependent receptor [Flavobacterium sp. F-30]